jgi:hypothetical protein
MGSLNYPTQSSGFWYWYFSLEVVTSLTLTDWRERHGVQGGMARVFAVMVQILLSAGAIAVQV